MSPVANYRSTTDHAELDRVLASAAGAAGAWAAGGADARAVALEGGADALEAGAGELVPVAMRESSLPQGRLERSEERRVGEGGRRRARTGKAGTKKRRRCSGQEPAGG